MRDKPPGTKVCFPPLLFQTRHGLRQPSSSSSRASAAFTATAPSPPNFFSPEYSKPGLAGGKAVKYFLETVLSRHGHADLRLLQSRPPAAYHIQPLDTEPVAEGGSSHPRRSGPVAPPCLLLLFYQALFCYSFASRDFLCVKRGTVSQVARVEEKMFVCSYLSLPSKSTSAVCIDFPPVGSWVCTASIITGPPWFAFFFGWF